MKDFAIFGIICILGVFGMGYLHESIHKEIYARDGINSKIYYFKYFPNMVTIADTPCNTDKCNILNVQNEIVNYNLMPFYWLLSAGILILIKEKE